MPIPPCPRAQVTPTGSRAVCSTFLDLAKYASISTTRTELEVPLPADGSVGTIKLTLVARWLKNYTSKDDDEDGSLSMFSGVTDLSSAGTSTDPTTPAITAGGGVGHAADGDGASASAAHNGEAADFRSPPASEQEQQKKALEDMWQTHMAMDRFRAGEGTPAATSEEVNGLREDLNAAHAENAQLQAEVRRLQGIVARVSDSTKLALAERATALEARLVRSERDRAEVEERIARAFTSVIVDLERQIDELRDVAGSESTVSGRTSPTAVGVTSGRFRFGRGQPRR